jgi:hypothetical protein
LIVPDLLDAVKFEQGEHQGFYDQTSDRWFKITLANKAGFVLDARDAVEGVAGNFESRLATPLEYLERLRLANEKFADGIRFLGVINASDGWRLVISQPNVEGGPPSQKDVLQFFRWRKFRAVNEKTYYRAVDNLLVGDAHTGNLKKLPNGSIVPFDVLLSQPAVSLRRSVEAPQTLSFD